MTLFLIGTGVSFDLTLSAISVLKNAEESYIETYTNLINEKDISGLEKMIGKQVKRLKREQVESDFLVKKAKSTTVCLLASGDPLTATTHAMLIMDAKKAGIDVKVIHNSSVYTAAPGISGLQIYRFGKTASLVNPRQNYKPLSSLDIIRKNLENDMHSLVLLDTEPEPMEARKALEMLKEFDSAIVLSRIGWADEKITHGSIKELLGNEKTLGKPPFAIVIPARLHPAEKEFLDVL